MVLFIVGVLMLICPVVFMDELIDKFEDSKMDPDLLLVCFPYFLVAYFYYYHLEFPHKSLNQIMVTTQLLS